MQTFARLPPASPFSTISPLSVFLAVILITFAAFVHCGMPEFDFDLILRRTMPTKEAQSCALRLGVPWQSKFQAVIQWQSSYAYHGQSDLGKPANMAKVFDTWIVIEISRDLCVSSAGHWPFEFN